MRRRSLAVVCLACAFTLVVVTPVGPVELSYVESGSMEPTISPGDGYVIDRTATVGPGDVVTFRFRGHGGYVTHRIVGVTDRGFVTKGDANPSTDQSGGQPYVTRDDVVGRVVTVGGEPLVIPHFRAAATAVDRYRVILVAAAALLVALSLGGGDASVDRTRPVQSYGSVVRTLLAVAVVASAGVLLATATAGTLTYVVVEESRTPGTLTKGEPATRNVSYAVSNVPTVDYIVRAEGATVVERTERSENGTVGLTLSVPPQDRIGPHEVRVRFVRYPSVAPRSLVAWVADRAVWLVPALTAIAAYLPLYLGYRLAVDPQVPVRLPRRRALRRWLQ